MAARRWRKEPSSGPCLRAAASRTPRDGHGHHQVSGILARDAYDLAGDTVRFPTRTTNGLGPWTVTHFYRGQRGNAANATYGFGRTSSGLITWRKSSVATWALVGSPNGRNAPASNR